MRSWLKGQDLQASCHWGREKKNWKEKKKSRPTKRCSTGFHCLLLALKPMFLQAYGAKLSAIVLLTLPPRQILTVGPMQSHPVGFQLMGSSLRNMQQVAVLLISSPKCMAGWSNRSLIQLLLAHQVWKQDKGCRANPTAQDPLLVVFQNSCDFCSGAASQFDIPWQPWCPSQQVAWSATEELAQQWHYEQPVLSWAN